MRGVTQLRPDTPHPKGVLELDGPLVHLVQAEMRELPRLVVAAAAPTRGGVQRRPEVRVDLPLEDLRAPYHLPVPVDLRGGRGAPWTSKAGRGNEVSFRKIVPPVPMGSAGLCQVS